MDKADEDLLRRVTALAESMSTPLGGKIRDLIRLTHFLNNLVSDLRLDSTAYIAGQENARHEILQMMQMRNCHFDPDMSPDERWSPEWFRGLLDRFLRTARLEHLTGREAVNERIVFLYRQHKLFGDATLPEICMMLRMGVNGSAEQWCPSDIRATLDMLRERLRTWHNENDWTRHSRVDDCVEQLVRATIEEVTSYDWWQHPEAGS